CTSMESAASSAASSGSQRSIHRSDPGTGPRYGGPGAIPRTRRTSTMSIRATAAPPHHPALLQAEAARAESAQNRVADEITKFAGSMAFVYLHIVWFAVWIVVRVEDYPFGLLTMIVSLEAIFLSTFVMISQNR